MASASVTGIELQITRLADKMESLGISIQSTINESLGSALAIQARRESNLDPLPQARRELFVPHSSLIKSLRKFLGNPTATFKTPEQAEAIEFVMAHERHLLLVGPTAMGKTLAYMLPAANHDHGITCVLLPLSALHTDFNRRCKDLKIETSRWTPENHKPRTKIVYVSPEHAQTRQFNDYLAELHSLQLLVQFVVDKAHLLATHSNFRYCLSALKPLISSGEFENKFH